MEDGKLYIQSYNEVHIKVRCEASIAYELKEYFTFSVPNAKFTPAFKNKVWDGKIRLYNTLTGLLYCGLISYLYQFAAERNYEVVLDGDFSVGEYGEEEYIKLTSKLDLTIKPRDYQLSAFLHAINYRRALLLSPTASGKSLIIFLITMWVLSKTEGKALVVVPTTSLVQQMASDFESYSPHAKNISHKITAGESKTTTKRVVISTWQSIYKQPKSWFEQFSLVIGDEAHLFKAQSLTSILNKMPKCRYRFGFTGTLDGTHTHKLVLEGLFGAVNKVTTTAELIDQQHLANFTIKGIVLSYDDNSRQTVKGYPYHDEIDWIVRNPKRNLFIKNLALSLQGNTLILFQFVEKHGKVLYDMMKDRPNTYFVSGAVDGEDRENIRKIVDIHKFGKLLTFKDKKVLIPPNTQVLLSCGKTKLSQNITIDDDVDDKWLSQNYKQYKYP